MLYAGGSLGHSLAARESRARVLGRFSQAVGLNGRFAHGRGLGSQMMARQYKGVPEYLCRYWIR